MVRRSAGFVAKRPHKKSRGGCLTCKRKKVKCNEDLPACGYCSLRKLDCIYPSSSPSSSPSNTTTGASTPILYQDDNSLANQFVDFNDMSVNIPSWLVPAVHSAKGQLTTMELSLLQLYTTTTWQSFVVRNDEKSIAVHSEWVPQHCLSQDHLLYALLTVTAMQSNYMNPSPHTQNHALVYRQKTLSAYNEALRNITSENYEALLITAVFMLALVPVPETDSGNDTQKYLNWVNTYLHMMQGLRMLASLRWNSGIEKLAVYPLFSREVRGLPPSPLANPPTDPRLYSDLGPLGTTPEYPNPPETYECSDQPISPDSTSEKIGSPEPSSPNGIIQQSSLPHRPLIRLKGAAWRTPSPAFLPPPLMALLKALIDPPLTGPIDLNRNYILPALRAMSPIFLSLYHYHLDPDFYIRIHVWPTYIPTEFFNLVKDREPRVLMIMQWYYVLLRFPPHQWIIRDIIPKVVQSIGDLLKEFISTGTSVVDVRLIKDSVEAMDRIMGAMNNGGREKAAESMFECWEGVKWDKGLGKADVWDIEDLVEWTP